MRSRWYGALAALLLALPVGAQTDATVRVRVLENEGPSRVAVEPMDGPAEIEVDGRQRGGVWTGEPITIERSQGAVTVQFGGAQIQGNEVRVRSGRLRVVAGRADRQYLGALVARAEGRALLLVNHTPTEPYVASVVASEFGFDALEGAKAQAVLARTYAARRAGAHAHYDLADHTGSQVFRGVSHATPTSRRAADETAGEVLTYRGEIAEAFYFSSSGGHTADNEVVWDGAPIPYLRGVPDPYDRVSPDRRWQTTAARAIVHEAVSRVVGGRVEGLEVAERTRSGRVRVLRVRGGNRPTISGPALRRAVNAIAGHRTVRSTRFDLSVEGSSYVFTGSGYGHGVGMSQYGALGMDREGRGYREILAHYFVGTEVRGGRSPLDPPLLAVATPGTRAAPVGRPPSSLRERYAPAHRATRPTPRREARLSEIFPNPPPTGDARQAERPEPRDDRRTDRRRADRDDGPDRRRADRRTSPTARRAAW